jgi:hypothetical protein
MKTSKDLSNNTVTKKSSSVKAVVKTPVVAERKRNNQRKGPRRTNGAVSTSLISAKNATTHNIMPISAPTNPLTLQSGAPAVTGIALGIVSYALQRNFAAMAPDPNYPYWAYVYLSTVFQSAMQDGVLKVATLPRFVKDICDALTPTHAKFADGYQAYNWNVDFDTSTAPYTYDLKPSGLPRIWNVGVVDNTPVNNLWHGIAAPAAYTEANGLAAWTSLLEYYSTLQVDEAWLKLVPANGPGKYRDDVSAFASIGKTIGNSGTDIGGYAQYASLEFPVHNPLFSCFSKIPSGQVIDPARFPAYITMKAMDSIALGGSLASGYNPRLVSSQLYPVLKNIDFMAFLEVMCFWIAAAAQLAANDNINSDVLTGNFEYYTLGITLQEFSLLLRNLMMNAFSDTQFFVQGNYPTDNFNNNDPFLPFVSGMGTYPVAEGLEMKLPQIFVENIRALTGVTQNNNNPITFIPVLGKFDKTELNWKDFYYLVPNTETPRYIFSDPTAAVRAEKFIVKNGKKEEIVGYTAETVISLVDGSTGSSTVAINSPFAMGTLERKWNELVTKVSPYVSVLTVLGNDAGIRPLRMITSTQVFFVNQPNHPSIPKNYNYVERILPDRFLKSYQNVPDKGASPYADKVLAAWNFYNPPISQAFGMIQNFWIAPVSQLWFNGTANEILTEQKMVSYARELNVITYTSGNDQITLENKHREYAQFMLKARDGGDNMQDVLLREFEKQGRGGFLSSLVGGLIKTIAPGSAKIVDTIAGVIPI